MSAAASSMKEPWDEKVKRVRANSPYSQLPNWSIPPIPGNLYIHVHPCMSMEDDARQMHTPKAASDFQKNTKN